jgi:hypothetical protein
VDPHHRVTVVLRGDLLRIEYKEGGDPKTIRVKAGQTDWDEPNDRPHRGVNSGSVPHEEITIFLLDHPGASRTSGRCCQLDEPAGGDRLAGAELYTLILLTVFRPF